MACNFINVGGSSSKCAENFSGVGSKFLLFTPEDLKSVPAYDGTAAKFTSASFAEMSYVVVQVKTKTGKVTATNNKNGGGFTNVYTGMVANDMASMSAVSRIMNNRSDWGILVPKKDGEYYVIYDPDFDIEFELSSDTGDAPDSDHGHTLTITCGPMLYPLPTWSGTLGTQKTDTSYATDMITGARQAGEQ